MRKSIALLLTLITLLLLGTACGLLEEPPTPSAPLEAVPLEETAVPAENPAGDEGLGEPETEDALAGEVEAESAAGAEEMTGGETGAEISAGDGEATSGDESEAEAPTAGGERRIYSIQPGESRVRFELDEDLRGQRTTVVGISDQVVGEIGFNLSDLSTAQVGVIQINARTLTTDNNFRNRAIQNEILNTGAFEFITFTPAAVTGLPASAAIGEEVTFAIDGELTIRDVTRPITFQVIATPVSDEELVGTATTTVSREAFALRIPDVPSVANGEDGVVLTIDFVAFEAG